MDGPQNSETVSVRVRYLVIDHNMDRTMCRVGGELTEMESLIYHTLSSKSSVTMYQDGHHLENNDFISFSTEKTQSKKPTWYLFSFNVSSIELLSFGFALNHWIHSL